jgi:ABC-type sugar transport system ATPase subunit
MTGSAHQPPAFALHGIAKSFAGVEVCKDIEIEISAGEVVALVGENGAGKSTTMKCLYGLYAPSEGHIEIAGEAVAFSSPRDAEAQGISMIPQELDLFPELSITENLFIGQARPRNGWGGFDHGVMRRRAKSIMSNLGVDIDVAAPVKSLSAAVGKLVEIGRALNRDARLVIMDEPTAALTDREVERLFTVIRRLKASGVAIVYISHRLDEVFAISDRIIVMRDKRVIRSGATQSFTVASLVEAMVGRPFEKLYHRNPPTPQGGGESRSLPSSLRGGSALQGRGRGLGGLSESRSPPGCDGAVLQHHQTPTPNPSRQGGGELCRHDPGAVALSIRGLSRRGEFANVSFDVRSGEILGLAGLIGAGRSEMAQAIYGIAPADTGEIAVKGQPIAIHSVADALRNGIAYLPEERRSQGLILPFSITSNISYAVLDRFTRLGFIDRRKEREFAREAAQNFTVAGAALSAPVEELSGGNQQKVLLAKILALDPKIVILDEPTRGVDVGAKAEIYGIIDKLAGKGKAILLISSEMNEVLSMSDRIIVMHEGRISGEFARAEFSQQAIGAAAAGQEVRHVA